MDSRGKDPQTARPAPTDRDERVQRQAKALGDPTRHAIFRAVTDAASPTDVATLTARFGLNHNAVRQHLAKLCASGLVIEEVGPSTGRGRPRLRYRPALGADGDWGIPTSYQELAMMLLDVLVGDRTPRQVGADAGWRMAQDLPSTPDPVDRLEINAARQGFEPRRVVGRSTVDLVLARCPFAAAAGAAPDVICQIHLGYAEGIAKASGGTIEVVDLVARDPRRAGCRLKVTRTVSARRG